MSGSIPEESWIDESIQESISASGVGLSSRSQPHKASGLRAPRNEHSSSKLLHSATIEEEDYLKEEDSILDEV